MRDLNHEADANTIETRVKGLERKLKFAVFGWLSTIGVLVLSAWGPQSLQTATTKPDVLRVRQLIVVDEKGTNRIVVGPIPDPQIQGKLVKRRTPATGVQVNDASGNERAGIAVLDDGSAVVGIDNERGEERVHVYYIPNRGSGVLLKGDQEKEQISLLIPGARAKSTGPRLELSDQTGKPVYPAPAR